MSDLANIHTRCLNLLKSIPKDLNINDSFSYGDSLFMYVNVFDEQIDDLILGDTYAFSTPSAFIEFDLGESFQLGIGFTSYPNCSVAIHIVDNFLDSNNGSMEYNSRVFLIRDKVKRKFQRAGFMVLSEKQDYKHGNIYKYIITFKFNYIENTGSDYDPEVGKIFSYIDNPNLNLNIFKYWVSGVEYKNNYSQANDVRYISNDDSYFKNEGGSIYVFSSGGKPYFLRNVVWYKNEIYVCEITNSDLVFNEDNWIKIKCWIPKIYTIGQFTFYDNELYVCVSDTDLFFSNNDWKKILR